MVNNTYSMRKSNEIDRNLMIENASIFSFDLDVAGLHVVEFDDIARFGSMSLSSFFEFCAFCCFPRRMLTHLVGVWQSEINNKWCMRSFNLLTQTHSKLFS